VLAREASKGKRRDAATDSAASIDETISSWVMGYVSGFEAANSKHAASKLAPKYEYDPLKSGDEKLVDTVYGQCKANPKFAILWVTARFVELEEQASK
jgi:hypothetical protein